MQNIIKRKSVCFFYFCVLFLIFVFLVLEQYFSQKEIQHPFGPFMEKENKNKTLNKHHDKGETFIGNIKNSQEIDHKMKEVNWTLKQQKQEQGDQIEILMPRNRQFQEQLKKQTQQVQQLPIDHKLFSVLGAIRIPKSAINAFINFTGIREMYNIIYIFIFISAQHFLTLTFTQKQTKNFTIVVIKKDRQSPLYFIKPYVYLFLILIFSEHCCRTDFCRLGKWWWNFWNVETR